MNDACTAALETLDRMEARAKADHAELTDMVQGIADLIDNWMKQGENNAQ